MEEDKLIEHTPKHAQSLRPLSSRGTIAGEIKDFRPWRNSFDDYSVIHDSEIPYDLFSVTDEPS